MVGKEGRRVMGVAAILFLTTSVLGQEPTAERRIAQGPGRNGEAIFRPCLIFYVDFSVLSPDRNNFRF